MLTRPVAIRLLTFFLTNVACLGAWAAEPVEVHLGSFSKAVDYAPYLVARHKRWFEQSLAKVGAHPNYQMYQTLPSINEAFAAKRLDAVIEAEAPAIIGRAAGLDLKILAVSCTLKQQIIVHKAETIRRVTELRGKRIAVLAGTSSHYGLINSLRKAGLSKSDVSVLDMTPPDAKSAFETNRVDAWAVWPPFAHQEQVAGTGIPLPGVTADIDVILVARDSFLREHKEIATAIKETLLHSKGWVAEHPGEAQEIVAKELNVPLAVIKLAWPLHSWGRQMDSQLIADIQRKADFLKEQGFIKNSVNAHEFAVQDSLAVTK